MITAGSSSQRSNWTLGLETLLEFSGRQVNVSQNRPQRTRLERTATVDGDHGIDVTAVEKVVAATNTHHCETLAPEKLQHFLAAYAR